MLEFGTKAVSADLPDEHVVSVKAKIFSWADLFDMGLMDHNGGGFFSFTNSLSSSDVYRAHG